MWPAHCRVTPIHPDHENPPASKPVGLGEIDEPCQILIPYHIYHLKIYVNRLREPFPTVSHDFVRPDRLHTLWRLHTPWRLGLKFHQPSDATTPRVAVQKVKLGR